ncbi:MAG: type VI secretion system tip protein VgrG [Bacteroidota bacterium]
MLNPSQLLPPLPGSANVITFTIKVNESVIASNFEVMAIETNRCFNRIPYALLTILDSGVAEQEFAASDQDIFSPGNKIEILAGYDGDESTIFKGIIIRHALRVPENGNPKIEIECKDQAVRMSLERKNRYFFDQTDQEIIEAVLSDYGPDISAEVESTNHTLAEVVQYHATDWDFVLTRADATAFLVEARDGKVIAKAPDFDAEEKIALNYGSSIFEFEAEMDARDQYPIAKAGSWDYSKQEVLEVEADENGATAATGFGAALGAVGAAVNAASGVAGGILPGVPPNTDYRNSLGISQMLLQHPGRLDQKELENWASAQYLKSKLAKQRGRVKFNGVADIYPGDNISLQNIGQRHTGKVLVTAVRQVIRDGSWFTHAQFGLPQVWFAQEHDDIQAPLAGGLLPAVHGLQVGVVTALAGDPDGQDRIQVRLPMVAQEGEGIWVRQTSLDAGNERGAFFRPEINDEVIVGFLNDDPRQGIMLGMLHGESKPAPLETIDDNNEKGFVTRSGMKLLFNDDKVTLTLETPGGNSAVIDDDAQSISLKDQHGNKIVMDSNGISIESAKDLILKATGDVKTEGINLESKAQAAFKAEGGASAELTSQAQTVVKGGIVQIN